MLLNPDTLKETAKVFHETLISQGYQLKPSQSREAFAYFLSSIRTRRNQPVKSFGNLVAYVRAQGAVYFDPCSLSTAEWLVFNKVQHSDPAYALEYPDEEVTDYREFVFRPENVGAKDFMNEMQKTVHKQITAHASTYVRPKLLPHSIMRDDIEGFVSSLSISCFRDDHKVDATRKAIINTLCDQLEYPDQEIYEMAKLVESFGYSPVEIEVNDSTLSGLERLIDKLMSKHRLLKKEWAQSNCAGVKFKAGDKVRIPGYSLWEYNGESDLDCNKAFGSCTGVILESYDYDHPIIPYMSYLIDIEGDIGQYIIPFERIVPYEEH